MGRFFDLTKERLTRFPTFARARGQDVRVLTSRLILASSTEKPTTCNRLLALRERGRYPGGDLRRLERRAPKPSRPLDAGICGKFVIG